MTRSVWWRTAAGGSIVLLLAASLLTAPSTSAESSLVVMTDRGAVEGSRSDGVEHFLGIPYAAPPTGTRRWKPPERAGHWSGTRMATRLGPACPVLPSLNGPRSETEDCLFVNVWRPAGTTRRDRLPVQLFIHGGGFINGSGSQYDESKIVAETGVISVSINYRLGVFGFLRTAGLAAESRDAGNYGFLDQKAALRWVQHNIGAFGGRRSRVSIDGESAGGFAVCGHLVSPGSQGLFRSAVIQSGSCASQTRRRAEERGAAYLTAAGCTSPSTAVACLRATPCVASSTPAGTTATRMPRPWCPAHPASPKLPPWPWPPGVSGACRC